MRTLTHDPIETEHPAYEDIADQDWPDSTQENYAEIPPPFEDFESQHTDFSTDEIPFEPTNAEEVSDED